MSTSHPARDAAPDTTVTLGFVGCGGRAGDGLLPLCLGMSDVRVPAVCDIHPPNLEKAAQAVRESGRPEPDTYADYRDLLAREDIEAVIIGTSWREHIPISIAAMKAGKYAAPEVGGATSLEECWQLVRASEDTGIPCMLLENYCYLREWMAVVNMVRQGIFGELVHCQGAYQHDLRGRIVQGKGTGPHPVGEGDYRSVENRFRNGDLYPTHSIGPVAQCLDINKGNRLLTLTSTASKARGLRQWTRDNLGSDHPAAGIDWTQGDIVTSVIKCQNGETIVLNHDVTLPRPMTDMGRVQGTKGIWMSEMNSIHVDGRSPEHKWESFDPYRDEYEHPLWTRYRDFGVKEGHHGSDYLLLRDMVESVKRRIQPPIDVYDSATFMAITPLSEESVACGSAPVSFPDFTGGRWMTTPPAFGTEERLAMFNFL